MQKMLCKDISIVSSISTIEINWWKSTILEKYVHIQ